MIETGRASICRAEDTARVVSPAISCRHSNRQGTRCELSLDVANCCRYLTHSSCFGDHFCCIMVALIPCCSCVGIFRISHRAMVTGEVPVVFHPSPLTAICSVGLIEHVPVIRRIGCAVNTLLLREPDWSCVVFDSLHGFLDCCGSERPARAAG